MTKNMMVKAVSDYFAKKGVEGMDLAEYKSQGSDVPVKDYMLCLLYTSPSPRDRG